MIKVGVGELREQISTLLQRVLEDGETIEVMVEGKSVARVVPEPYRAHTPEEVAEDLMSLDELSAKITAAWQGEPNAVEAVREQRRDL